MQFQDGDIILEKVNDFGSWYRWILAKGIQFMDGVYYHHALTFYYEYLYEAQERVVAKNAYGDRLKGSEILVLRLKTPLNERERLEFQKELFLALNKKYDYTGTLLFQFLYILFFRRVWFGRTNKKSRRRYYCTELVADVINGVRGYFPTPWKTSPSEIMKIAPLYYDVVFEGEWK